MGVFLKPLHDRLLVRPVKSRSITAGGIVIPETAKEKPQEGEVIAVGNGTLLIDGRIKPIDVKDGERILYIKNAGIPVKVGEENLLLLRECEVLAVIADRKT